MGGLAGSAPFTYTPTGADWLRILPELILFVAALLVMMADLITPNGRKGWLAAVGLLGVIAAAVAAGVLYVYGDGGAAFYNMVSDDKIALVADFIILFSVGLGLLYSPGYLERQQITREGEYYTLLLLAALGMMLMSAAISLMTIFVGLEVLSLALYVLCALAQGRERSQEAGLKYFILSSFASAFLLYGMALTYGATGATALVGIRDFVTHHTLALTGGYGPLLLAGLGLMAVGFCFKVSAVPFQAWTPDVYVGAPTPVTAFMSVGTKVAAFMGLARVFFYALSPQSAKWAPIFWAVAILTMVGGNLLAVTQRDVKRMLAYSSIANAGYMLVAVATDTQRALASLLIYLGVYAVMNIGAFGVVLAVERNDGLGTTLDDFAGLARRRPGLAAAMAILLFGLSGLFGAGLIGKYYVFYAAIVGNHLDLAAVGILSSVLGMFYYLRVVWAMYFTPPQPVIGAAEGAITAADSTEASFVVAAPAPVVRGGVAVAARPAVAPVATRRAQPAVAQLAPLPMGAQFAIALTAALTIALGIAPGALDLLATQAARVLLP